MEEIDCKEIGIDSFMRRKKEEYILGWGRNCNSNGLKFAETLKCDLSLLVSLADLQLYCSSMDLKHPDSFPSNERETLYNKILDQAISLKPDLIRLDPKKFKMFAFAIRDYRKTINEEKINYKLSFHLAQAIYVEGKSIGSDKILDTKLFSTENEEDLKKNSILKYLELRLNSYALFRIYEEANSVHTAAEQLVEGEPLVLLILDVLSVLGEYIKTIPPTNTYNIDANLNSELQAFVPVKELAIFRNMITHKHLMPLITSEDAGGIFRHLPTLIAIFKKQLIELENKFIQDIKNELAPKLKNEKILNRIFPEKPDNKNIPKRISEIIQDVELDDKLLLKEALGKIEQLNSIGLDGDNEFKPKDVEEIKKIKQVFTCKESQIKGELQSIVTNGVKIAEEHSGKIIDCLLQNSSLQKSSQQNQQNQRNQLFSKISLKEYLQANEISDEVSKMLVSNIEDLYVSKIEDEYSTLRQLKDVHMFIPQIIKLYDTLERYSNFRGSDLKIPKMKSIRNYLAHGDSFVDFEDDVRNLEEAKNFLMKAINEIDTKLFEAIKPSLSEKLLSKKSTGISDIGELYNYLESKNANPEKIEVIKNLVKSKIGNIVTLDEFEKLIDTIVRFSEDGDESKVTYTR